MLSKLISSSEPKSKRNVHSLNFTICSEEGETPKQAP
jgi:hypothetical protein